MKILWTTLFAALVALTFAGCTPEPGTEAWCEMMKEKPKGDWTASDTGTFTKHCVLSNYKKDY